MKRFERVYTICMEVWQLCRSSCTEWSLFLGRQGVRPPRNHLGSENILLEEALLDKLFQVSSEVPTVNSLVPFTVIVQAVLLRPGQWQIGLDRLWASDPWLIFESVEDFIDQEFQWSEIFCSPVALDWPWWDYGERLFLVRMRPPIKIRSMIESFTSGLWFRSILARLWWGVGGSLHYFLQLNVWLCPEESLAPLGDIVLKKMLV